MLVFPAEWTRVLPFLNGPEGRGLVIPIEGTLKKPRLETGTVRRILKEIGQGALEDLLQGPLRRLLDR
ncbi:MAG: hypothetical protein NT069_23910 [Planctomycetota bacterium]|nr:hypothetical protein [Planctomycetota bacterium]